MEGISIITPVYNRADKIKKIYESLNNHQTDRNFEWIIVDDGSNDNLKSVVDGFGKNIDIKFIQKENGGKCSALNVAAYYCTMDFLMVVDSDDYLVSDAVKKINTIADFIRKDQEIIGIVAYRIFENGDISGKEFPINQNCVGYNELNYHFNQDGETTLIYRTSIIKNHKHRIFNGENFLSEEIQYNELDKLGDLWILREPLIIMEYLEDGLTNHFFENWLRNPCGTKLLMKSKYSANKNLNAVDTLVKKSKTLLQYDVLNIYSDNFKLEDSPNPMLARLILPMSWLLKKKITKGTIEWSE